MTNAIRNVSGTAFWIAQFRAMETAQRYPLFRDPWAAELAGARGREVMRALRGSQRSAWAMVIRTAVLDQLVVEAVAEHEFDTVLSLGAGLDTRAYRLPLPKRLRWFEVDMPEIVAYKQHALRDATPRCEYRALSAELSDDAVRADTIARVTADSAKTLIITEGVLEYLEPAAVHGLARELFAQPACHTWLCNLLSPIARQAMPRWRRTLASVNATIRFTPEESSAFFRDDGWLEAEWVSMLARGMAYGRLPFHVRLALRFLPYVSAERQERASRIIGVAKLARADVGSLRLPSAFEHGPSAGSLQVTH